MIALIVVASVLAYLAVGLGCARWNYQDDRAAYIDGTTDQQPTRADIERAAERWLGSVEHFDTVCACVALVVFWPVMVAFVAVAAIVASKPRPSRAEIELDRREADRVAAEALAERERDLAALHQRIVDLEREGAEWRRSHGEVTP